jgi:hypothetical protein
VIDVLKRPGVPFPLGSSLRATAEWAARFCSLTARGSVNRGRDVGMPDWFLLHFHIDSYLRSIAAWVCSKVHQARLPLGHAEIAAGLMWTSNTASAAVARNGYAQAFCYRWSLDLGIIRQENTG